VVKKEKTMPETFRALLLTEDAGTVKADIADVPTRDLPDHDVLVDVAYSTLNYKDGLALTGQGRVVRNYPMVPGIDYAGTVVESHSPAWKPGDRVILTGWEVGEKHWGGLGERARAKAEWLVPLPEGMSLQQAMGIGTAGFTAMLCVLALEEHGLTPGEHPVIVTGAGGGVGSTAVALLANLGHRVAASTGRAELHDYLQGIGAAEIVDRATLAAKKRPLESEHWAGAVDSVGGDVLAGILPAMRAQSSVAACGVAGGPALATTVFPFILRGVNLLGIHSVLVPQERRRMAWDRLAHDLPAEALDRITQVVPLSDVPTLGQEILKGTIRGRIVVDVRG
jgi:acrylyl-CoA reductase (NADPH)